jgi:ribosomal protein S9
MDSKIELIFQKKNIGLGKRKESTARVFLIPEEILLLTKFLVILTI